MQQPLKITWLHGREREFHLTGRLRPRVDARRRDCVFDVF